MNRSSRGGDSKSRYEEKRRAVMAPLSYADEDEFDLWEGRIGVLAEEYGSKKAGVEAAIAAEVRRIERKKK